MVEIDLERFERLAREARAMSQNAPVKAITAYKEAVNQYGGLFLPEDLYADWIVKRRYYFQNLRMDLVMEQAGLHEQLGHFRKAADGYQTVLAMDPTLEETARRLMNLLTAHGRRNQALKVFDQLQTSLKNQLGVNPEKMTQLIYQKIIDS